MIMSIGLLRELMSFDACMKSIDIETRFEQIAEMLFESFAIQKGKTMYLFKEIEFYFYNKNHRDIIAHPRVSKALCWYINDFGGIDLNFTSNIKLGIKLDNKGKKVWKYILDDNSYFGGILVRQLICEDGTENLTGPWACAELFRGYDATGVDMYNDLPILVEHDCGKGNYIRGARRNLLRSNQQPEKKVDNILYAYLEHPRKDILYKDFLKFKDKPYRYEKQ